MITTSSRGKENLFEFKQHRMIMTGPGSIHKNGNVYKADWKMIPAMPDVLLHRLCELYGAPKPGKTGVMSEEAKRRDGAVEPLPSNVWKRQPTAIGSTKGSRYYARLNAPERHARKFKRGHVNVCCVHGERRLRV